MAEKFLNNTKTTTATKISTKAKIILGLMVGLGIIGMFVLIGGLDNNNQNLQQSVNTTKTATKDKLQNSSIKLGQNSGSVDSSRGSAMCKCSNGKLCGNGSYNYSGSIGDISYLCSNCCAEFGGTCISVTTEANVKCGCANNEICYEKQATNSNELSVVIDNCNTCCKDQKNSSFANLIWE